MILDHVPANSLTIYTLNNTHFLASRGHSSLTIITNINGRYFTYRSLKKESWPPTIIEIVSLSTRITILDAYSQEQASYPVPQVLLLQVVEDKLRRSPRRQCSRKCKKLESTFFYPLAVCFDLRKSGALGMVGFQCTSTASLGTCN